MGKKRRREKKQKRRKEETDDHRKGEGQEKGEEKACDRRRQFIKKKHVNLKERLRERRARGKEWAILDSIQSSQGEKGRKPGERPGLS